MGIGSKIGIGLMVILFLFCFVQDASGLLCKRKTIFGKIRFSCPEPGQEPEMSFCCGVDDDFGGQYCCRNPFRGIDIDDKTVAAVANNIGKIIATIAGIIGFLIILVLVCCCCCPFCLLYKRRNAGTVYRSSVVTNPTNGERAVNVTVAPPPATSGPGTGPPPPGFNTQPPPPSGYPAQPNATGYPPAPYPANPGFPPYPVAPGYPPQPSYPPQPYYNPNDQPPPYSGIQEGYQKQAPYNPNY